MENNFWTSVFGWATGKKDIMNRNSNLNEFWGTKKPVWVDTNKPIDLFMTVPELRAVIERRASMMSSAKPKIVDDDGNEIENHPWLYEIINKPNPLQSWSDVIFSLSINDALFNNAFAYSPKLAFDFRKQIVPLPSSMMKIKLSGRFLNQLDSGGLFDGFEFHYNENDFETIEIDDMVYLATPDGINLINPSNRIETLKFPLSNIVSQYKKRNVLLENLTALGILSTQKSDMGGSLPLTDDERKKIRNDWKRRNRDEIIMTEANVNWTPMNFPTRDLLLFEELDADRMAIIDAFGMSHHIFSKESGSTFSNVREGMRMTYQDTIIPETQQMYDSISHQWKLPENGIHLIADFSHVAILQSDMKEQAEAMDKRASAVQKIIEMGLDLTPDEIKLLLNI
jgi:hypothetical protein